MILNTEQLNALLLLEYHQCQRAELLSDIDMGLVRPIDDWKEGWGRKLFEPSLISATPEQLQHQYLTYQAGIQFHERRASELKAAFPELSELRMNAEHETYCETFKFGTEPTIPELLAFLFKVKRKVPVVAVVAEGARGGGGGRMSTNSNRERWLLKAVDLFARRLFKQHDVTLPEVKVSVGFPGGRGSAKHIGQHWAPEASDDKKGSIFIHPSIDDSAEVLGILIHELVHAAVGNKHGHGPKFKALALKVGLEGPMRSTQTGTELQAKIKAWLKQLGEYPHAKLNLEMGPVKKQTTRMIKMECGECGYIARASRKLIDHLGPVLCPCNGEKMNVEESEGDE